jgi:competence protein ComEC
VLLIRYGQFTYATTGDLPGGGGNPPYDTVDVESLLAPVIGQVDVLHLGHHGSHTSSNLKFLETLSPRAAIISVGDGNTYHHPHPSVLQRLTQLQIPVYQTERGHQDGTEASHVMDGNVIIESDGKNFYFGK